MIDTSQTIIVQRIIPHYRVALFERLYERYGLRVVTAETPPGGSFMNLADPRDLPFAVPAPFRFPNPANPFRADVPTGWILDRIKPRAVIAEFGMRMSSTYDLAVRRRVGGLRRLAFWCHGWQMERGFESLTDRAVQYGRLPLYAAADVIATYTEEGARWVRRGLPRQPVVALGNTLDTEAIARVAASSQPVRHGQPQLLAVGRLTADKGFDQVIALFRRVRDRFPDAALTIIGDGPERTRLQALAEEQPPGAVRMTGALYDEADLAPHFLGADLFVLPGAAGLSVNHALAYALPVIAFARSQSGPRHHPEIEYVVNGVTGILVDQPTLDAMADTLIANIAVGAQFRLKECLLNGERQPTLDKVVAQFGRLIGALN